LGITQSGSANTYSVWEKGLRGEGQLIQVADSGLDVNHCFFRDDSGNVPFTDELEEAHFLIDRSGYIRARYKHFVSEENNVVQLTTQAAILAQEPIVEINLHSH
jgi:hypothetical protein